MHTKTDEIRLEIAEIFARHALQNKLQGSLVVTTPLTGEPVAEITSECVETTGSIIQKVSEAQAPWMEVGIETRIEFLRFLAEALAKSSADLAKLVNYDAGKSLNESTSEVSSAIGLIGNIIQASSYEPLTSGAERTKEFTPLGVIAIISPFNFPMAIGMWTGIPALLAGNTVINKPSEHASLVAIVYEAIFAEAINQFNVRIGRKVIPENTFRVAVGGAEIGKAIVADQRVAKVVFTGSVAGCETIKESDIKFSARSKSLTEGGAANFAVFSNRHDGMTRKAYINFVVGATMKSYLPYAGQKCVNTRQIVAHADIFADVVEEFKDQISIFKKGWDCANVFSGDNSFEYTPLINWQAGQRFQWALHQAIEQGGELFGGERLDGDDCRNAQYFLPAIAVFTTRVPLLDEEIFGPFLTLIPYSGDVTDAMALVQKPNANLVNAYFGSDEQDINLFKRTNTAGFTLINPPLGTGLLPPYGLGFGGNNLSGQGESLPRDPLLPFVRSEGSIKRYVTFKLPASSAAC